MKIKLLITSLLLIFTSTQIHAARPSIASLDAKLDVLAAEIETLTTPPEYGKITLFGDLAEGESSVFSSASAPADRRFHVRHVSCGHRGYNTILAPRPFRVLIWATHFSPEIGANVNETVASTPTYEPDVVTLLDIFNTSFPATIAIDPGATIRMQLVRRDGNTDGFITQFNCTLGGFMEEIL